MKIVSGTDKGLLRRSNQDAYKTVKLPADAVLAVVCDGMGGTAGGDVASGIAVDTICSFITERYRAESADSSVKNLLITAVNAANIAVYDAGVSDNSLAGMGTTVVVSLVRKDAVYTVHAGDSRAYLFFGGTLNRLTHDHSIVQQMVDNGNLSNEEARNHPRSNIITRALGVDEELEVDYCEYPFFPGSILLICTDGLTKHVTDDDIASVLSSEPESIAKRLIASAISDGGSDNITAVAVIA